MSHPLFEYRSRQIIWWLVWLALAVGQSAMTYFVYGSNITISLTDGLITMLLYSAIGLALWFPLRYMQKDGSNASSTISNIIIAGGVTVTLWIVLTDVIVSALIRDKDTYEVFWNSTLVIRIVTGIFLFCMIILTYYLFISTSRLAEKAKKQSQLETLVREAEIKMLRSQINPHFLFNSLNSISSLTLTDPSKAHEMIVKLSDFMRYSLSSRDDQMVSVKNEMSSMRLYLEIEKVRFRERLVTDEEIEEDSLEAQIPGLLLQPLYENAVKHGVYESVKTITIRTRVVKKKNKLIITISNTIDTDVVVTRKGTGIGLKNVRNRLDLFFGDDAGMTVDRQDDIYTVTILLPFRKP